MAREIDLIFKGSDNTNEILLKKDGVPQDLSSVTRMALHFSDGVDVTNSTGAAYPIKWSGTGRTGLVVCQLGDESLTEGDLTAKLLTYDPVNPDGIVWSGKNGINFHVTQATAN
jgi:hypothetical protein